MANKIRDEQGRAAVDALAASEGVEVAGAVPHDVWMLEADLACRALLDFAPDTPAVTAIDELADELLTADALHV